MVRVKQAAASVDSTEFEDLYFSQLTYLLIKDVLPTPKVKQEKN